GCALRRAEPKPTTGLVAGHKFIDGGKVRQHLQVRSTGYGEGSQLAASDVLQRPRYHGKSGLHLSADQIGHITAPVLDPNPLDARHRFEQFTSEKRRRGPDAD